MFFEGVRLQPHRPEPVKMLALATEEIRRSSSIDLRNKPHSAHDVGLSGGCRKREAEFGN
jgi:hypothetical protein